MFGLPEVNLDKILGRPFVPRYIHRHQGDDGSLPKNQLQVLLGIALAKQPGLVLEVGTFMGSTTAVLAEWLPSALIHTIDLPLDAAVPDDPEKDPHLIARRDVGRDYRSKPCAKRITQHLCNTFTDFPTTMGSPDFIFIDADHSYDGCRNDSEKSLALVRDRPATFVWHDCDANHPGVVLLLVEWRYLAERDIRKIAGFPMAYWQKL